MLCFGIFVIVGFWSHLKIAMCFAYLVAKKMQEEKKWENLLDLNSCEFWFLILILFFYLVKINKLIFLNLYANVSWVMWIFNNI